VGEVHEMDAIDLGIQSFLFFLLVFARLVGVFVQAPLFGRPRGVPMAAQVGYSLAISLVLFHVLPIPAHMPDTPLTFAFTIAGQVLIGLVLGFAAYIVAAGAQFAGELVDIQLGLSVAASFDPSSGGTVNLMRQFEFRLALLVWIFIHGDYFFFRAVARSYELIPADTFSLPPAAIMKLVDMSNGIFVMAMELSAPVLVAIFITQLGLGLLNRAAQQFNVFMISFPVNILIGLGVLILSLSPMLYKALPNLYYHWNQDYINLILALKKGAH